MSRVEVFRDVDFEELKHIYEEILKGREEGLRPRCMNKYIEKVRAVYTTMNFGEAWRHTENLFWDEIGRRYFGCLYHCV